MMMMMKSFGWIRRTVPYYYLAGCGATSSSYLSLSLPLSSSIFQPMYTVFIYDEYTTLLQLYRYIYTYIYLEWKSSESFMFSSILSSVLPPYTLSILHAFIHEHDAYRWPTQTYRTSGFYAQSILPTGKPANHAYVLLLPVVRKLHHTKTSD
jgi:hypothetical protein